MENVWKKVLIERRIKNRFDQDSETCYHLRQIPFTFHCSVPLPMCRILAQKKTTYVKHFCLNFSLLANTWIKLVAWNLNTAYFCTIAKLVSYCISFNARKILHCCQWIGLVSCLCLECVRGYLSRFCLPDLLMPTCLMVDEFATQTGKLVHHPRATWSWLSVQVAHANDFANSFL